MEEKERMMAMADEDYEAKEVFDSNCITPGTKFMVRLSKNLKYFIQKKVSEDPVWQVPDIIFSGHEVPGEGEHKLMDYIRQEKMQADYPPNLRHCIYGLDADLIMLALATHEVKFSILREEVVFGKQPPKPRKPLRRQGDSPYAAEGVEKRGEWGEHDGDSLSQKGRGKPLKLLRISTLREYLRAEFRECESVPFGYDFERVIDDFVFICFFVGNDFLPHLPSLDIRDGGLEFLLAVYKRRLPSLGGYLSDAGVVDLSRVDVLLPEVGQVEDSVFSRRRCRQ